MLIKNSWCNYTSERFFINYLHHLNRFQSIFEVENKKWLKLTISFVHKRSNESAVDWSINENRAKANKKNTWYVP